MIDVAHNLDRLTYVIEGERGPLDLLALFKRENQLTWELVIAAPWATGRVRDTVEYVGRVGAAVLDPDETREISSILILDKAVATLSSLFPGPGEYGHFLLNEVPVERAIIARLRPPIRKTRGPVAPQQAP